MRTRLATILSILLLALGVAACDDTADGVGEDAEQIQEGADDAVDDLEEGDDD